MKSYYVTFYNGDKAVCGTWRKAKDVEEACMMAEFALMCRYPHIEYTSVSAK